MIEFQEGRKMNKKQCCVSSSNWSTCLTFDIRTSQNEFEVLRKQKQKTKPKTVDKGQSFGSLRYQIMKS